MEQKLKQQDMDVITLKVAIKFLQRNGFKLMIGGLCGAALAMYYIMATPQSYEARWQMLMAQMVVSNSEDPAALVQRLRPSSTYTAEVLNHCGKTGEEEVEEYLDKTLQVQIVKNVPNSVEFKLRAASVEQVKACSNAIVGMVIAQQREIINERLAGKQEQLAQYQQALKDEMRQLEKLKKTELGNFGYLAMLDKLTWLRARIDGLQEELFLSQKHPAKLNAPIQVSRKPVSPKVSLIWALGLLLGLMTGLLYAIAREVWRKQMSEA